MAILEDAFKGNVATAVAIGIGAVVLRPVLVPIVRPVFKAVLKAGVLAYDQGRLAAAELGEGYGDLVAEARAEMSAANGSAEPTETSQPAARRPAPKAATSRDEEHNK